jgi:hypothetical protein
LLLTGWLWSVPALQELPSPLPFCTAPVVGSVVPPASAALKQPPDGWASPRATHRGVYPQLRWVWPRRWHRLHLTGPFGAANVSTCDPQSAQLDEGAPRHRHSKVRSERAVILRAAPRSQLYHALDIMPRAPSSPSATLSGIVLPRFFTGSRTLRSFGMQPAAKPGSHACLRPL